LRGSYSPKCLEGDFREVAAQRGGFAKRCLRADLGEKERHASRGEVRKMRSYRLAFSSAAKPPAAAPDPRSTALCDQVIGQLAAIGQDARSLARNGEKRPRHPSISARVASVWCPSGLFRQSLEEEFSELPLHGVLGSTHGLGPTPMNTLAEVGFLEEYYRETSLNPHTERERARAPGCSYLPLGACRVPLLP
jgi:hypothetical protein